ncbi:MAG: lytic transglycosylase domain-containing protein [Chloroflexi bacterium]|nr:lytic transglycosylase domain-containing protein [Chloroflexota bacterium]
MPRCKPAGVALAVVLAALLAASCTGRARPTAEATVEPSAVALTPTAEVSPSPQPTATPVPATAERAARLLSEGRYAEAAVAWAAVAAAEPGASPGRADALVGEAVALGEVGRGADAIRRLRDAVAAAPVTTPAGLRAAYLLGRRLNDAGGWIEAEAVLRPASIANTGTLLPYVRHEYARAAARVGPASAANAAWDTLLASPATPSSLYVAILRERAEVALGAGDVPGQIRWLTELAALTDLPADHSRLAAVAAEAGESGLAVAQWQALVAGSPGSVYALGALDALRAAGQPADAGTEGFVYYRRGMLAEARDVLAVGVREGGLRAGELTFRYFYLGAALEDLGDYRAAQENYDRAAAQGTSDRYAHRARYWAARMAEALGDPRGASQRYVALVQSGPPGEFTEESAFRAGYTLLASGEPAAAVAAWDGLQLAASARLLYWKARAYADEGDRAAANAAYRASAESEPLAFHAMEAARALNGTAAPNVGYTARDLSGPDWAALEAWLGPLLGAMPAPGAPSPAADLVAVGLRSEASELLSLDAERAGGWELYRVIREAHGLGLVDLAARLGVRLRISLGVRDWEAPRPLLKVIYPVAYVATLDAVSRENGVDPLWLAALVRQESFWDPAAGSTAGALGLTQVIPVTGEAIAASLGYEGFGANDLFRPAVSLEFGANYIGGQLRRFGDPYAALAAYNAGPGAAARWAAAAAGLPPADFVEAVDYAETKHYVQAVMEHYAHYLAAYAP